MGKVNIRGIEFDSMTMSEVLRQLKSVLGSKPVTPYTVFTLNSEIVQTCIENAELMDIVNAASLVVPDGAGVVFASKILKRPVAEKVAGIEIAYHLLDYLNETGGKLFLLGAKEEVVRLAAVNLDKKYGNIKVEFNNGYFNKTNEENDNVIGKINAYNPDLIFVCFGAPASEKWMYANKERINAKMMIGLGGTIDDIAGVVKRAPKIMIRLNLEWLYRLVKQPKRIGRMMKIPKFLFGTYINRNK